jgi:benzoyl-CoA reductase/2-hydroxyglutaryl-CoA dehydratase subunit BcrC/BadD/HgdB
MKIDLSEKISNVLFNSIKNNGNSSNKSEALLRAYRAVSTINSLNPKIPKSDRLYLRMAIDYYARVLRAGKKKGFVAAYSLCCPIEILYAMDIVPIQLEATGWLLATFLGETGRLLASSNEVGLATEICSVHRLIAGSFAMQLLPRANVVVWTNIPCENSAKSGPLLEKLNDCPGFFLDHPYEPTPENEKYLAEEYKSLISFLEEKSGHKMNYDRLMEAIARSNRQIGLCREISQFRKNTPSPFPSFTFLRVFMSHLLFGGQPEGTVYLEALRNELAGRVWKGKGILTKERYRLINMNLPPLYFMGPLEEMFREYGAIDVVNPFFLDWQAGELDLSKPLQSLARKSFMNPLMNICASVNQPMLDTLKQDVSDYKIDGAINYAHIGCGSYGGISRLMRDTLREAGVPMLDLSCDITDPTVVTPEEMREQLVRFFEQLEDR